MNTQLVSESWRNDLRRRKTLSFAVRSVIREKPLRHPFPLYIKNIKYLGINLIKDAQGLYIEKYQTLKIIKNVHRLEASIL